MYHKIKILKNYKYEHRKIITHQGLIVNGRMTNFREIHEYISTIDFGTANYFYQNPLNRELPQTEDIRVEIINPYEVRNRNELRI